MDKELYKLMISVSNMSKLTGDVATMLSAKFETMTESEKKDFKDWLKLVKREENHHIQQANTYGRMGRVYNR